MKFRELLRADIPKTLTARAVVLIFLVIAFVSIYVVVKITTAPKSPGETPGEVVMARGAVFFTLGPFAAVAAFVSATVANWQKRHLSRPWFLAGVSPVVALVPAAIYCLFNLGRLP